MVKFTIAIPAYKARFIRECIQSVLKQSFYNFELIIVNDASPESVENIVEEFIDPRIRYFKNEVNFGAANVVDNWNKCLNYALGEFFVLLGDDDKLDPDYLTEFDKLIKTYPELDVYHCRSNIIDENSVIIGQSPSWPEFESTMDNIWHRTKGLRVQFISDFVYRTKPLKDNGGFYFLPLGWASDDITSYQQMGQKGIAHTNKSLLNYRESSITLSNSGSGKLKMEAIKGEEDWLNSFLKDFTGSKNEILIGERIRKYLPKYFSDKRIFTVSQLLKYHYFHGLIFLFSELKARRLSIIQGIAALMKGSVLKLKNHKK